MGFREYPNDFVVEIIEANVNDYNEISGEFKNQVYYLSHEWYDGEYDYVSDLGYYSTRQKAEMAKSLYQFDSEFIEHQDGFEIEEYTIDIMAWKEGFVSWDEMEE